MIILQMTLTMKAYLFPVHVTTRMHLVLHPPVKNARQTVSTEFTSEEELLVC
jgi:hypothetical protein